MIDKPLYQNPLGGGQATLVPNPGAGTVPRGGAQDVDPIMQGFHNSEFRKNANMMQQDAVNFKYKGQDMMMNGSMSGAFKQYLDSIGKGDLYESNILGGELATVNPIVSDNDPYDLGSAKPGVNPIVSDPSSSIASINGPGLLEGPPVFMTPGLPPQEEYDPDKYADFAQKAQIKGPGDTLFDVANNPYNRVGQQLMGPNQFNDQFSSMGDRLTKLEEGIASLLNQNRGFGFNSMQPRYGAPNYGYSPFSMTGLGSLFGGYYG